jgi:large subunit ribosomal protein L4
MQLQLQDIKGRVVGEVPVSETLFGAPFNNSLVHQAMVMYQLNARQGTHKVKVRSEVSGGGAKPWRQKHTGRARHGSIRSPIWRGGGVTFGPHPRSYRRDMPKRMRHLALRCVLTQKLEAGRVVLVEDFDDITGRTRDMIQALSNLNTSGSTLIVTASSETNVVRSARNIPRVWTMPANLLNAGELLKRSNLVLTLDALRRAEELWGEGADSVQVLPVGTSPNGHEEVEADEPAIVEEPVLEETSEPAEAALDEAPADAEPDASDENNEPQKQEGEA